ncbi:MAG TPA: PaaI family thioesterase [bacterium]|nr:PaaI family thioesterase [bacterium]
MRKIRNPFSTSPGYHCFGCCPTNPIGLQMEFWLDGGDLVAIWQPKPEYQGWGNILHGGIQTTLLDEIGGWIILVALEKAGVTAQMELAFLKPVSILDGPLTIRCRILEQKRRIVFVESELLNPAGEICTRGKTRYFTFERENAPEHLRFPDKEAFFEQEETL